MRLLDLVIILSAISFISMNCGSGKYRMLMVGEDRSYANHAVQGLVEVYKHITDDSIVVIDKIDTLGLLLYISSSTYQFIDVL